MSSPRPRPVPPSRKRDTRAEERPRPDSAADQEKDDLVDAMSEDSFPASDPPSFAHTIATRRHEGPHENR